MKQKSHLTNGLYDIRSRKRFRSNEIGIPTPIIHCYRRSLMRPAAVVAMICGIRCIYIYPYILYINMFISYTHTHIFIYIYTYIYRRTCLLLYTAVCSAPRFWNRNTRVILFLKIYTYYTLGWFLFWFIKTVNTHFVIHTRLPCRRTAHHAIHIY